MEETNTIDNAVVDSSTSFQEDRKGILKRINEFVGGRRGWLSLIALAVMIVLTGYFIINIEMIKANPADLCRNVGCFCANNISLIK